MLGGGLPSWVSESEVQPASEDWGERESEVEAEDGEAEGSDIGAAIALPTGAGPGTRKEAAGILGMKRV